MNFQKTFAFKFKTAIRLLVMVGIRRVRVIWNSHTIEESLQGNATPLEAAAYLTLQNLPRLKKRKRVDAKLRKYIKKGYIRRGVLANGYPDPVPEQTQLFDAENQKESTVSNKDMASLIEEVNTIETDLLRQDYDLDVDDGDYEYDDRPLFLYGLLTGAILTALVPLWFWLSPQILQMPLVKTEQYSPQVIQVAAARGQDCARSRDLYSQLYCGELWRKELSARVEQHYTDLLAVSTAIDSMHKQTGFEVAQPLARRVQGTHQAWQLLLEESCNTAAAVENLGAKRGNRYLDCIHGQLLARESEIREQLNYLRGLGWHEEADDALNNELIAIRNMAASQPPAESPGESADSEATEPEAADPAPEAVPPVPSDSP